MRLTVKMNPGWEDELQNIAYQKLASEGVVIECPNCHKKIRITAPVSCLLSLHIRNLLSDKMGVVFYPHHQWR